MTTHGTFTFDAENDSDCQRFDFTSDGNGQTSGVLISGPGTAADFCHDTNGGNSANVGPDFGQGGDPDGYLYTECSSPGASGDEYTMTFDTLLDALAEQWQFNFYWCQRGPAAGNNDAFCEVQINEDGGGWVTVATFGGVGEDSTSTVWNYESVDLSESGVNVDENTQVRIRIESQSETSWHADFGIDTVTIVGSPAGITSVTPSEFDMDNADIDITSSGDVFDASGNDVYISDADTLAGSANEVDISSAINTESTSLINLDLTQLSAGELASLHTLGPSATRYIIVDAVGGEYSYPITLHRPEAFVMSLSSEFAPGATTVQLLAPATKTTGDFNAGRIEEVANPATAIDITDENYTEVESCFQATVNSREVQYDFRIEGLDTYTVTPQLTISAAVGNAMPMAMNDFRRRRVQ